MVADRRAGADCPPQGNRGVVDSSCACRCHEGGRLQGPRWLWPLWAVACAIPATTAAFIYLGGTWAVVVGVHLGAALLGWLATTYRRPARPGTVTWVIAAVVALLVYGWEQWSHGGTASLAGALPTSPETAEAWFHVVPFATTIVFLLGAVGLFIGHPAGNYLAWLTFTFATITGVLHLMSLPFASHGQVTIAAVPLLGIGVFGIVHLMGHRVKKVRE